MGSGQIGRLFDIKKFATHDGDGIRTTLFLKGCPMRCAWCQNPEGISPEYRLTYFENKCIRCGTCAALAGDGSVRMAGGAPVFDRGKRRDWAAIIDACPTGAVTMDGADYTVEEAMEAVRQDVPFYRYGGGVTLSGGEPLMQSAFARSLLEQCRAEGIHTAMETSLYAPPEALESMLPFLDMVYADVKLLDSDRHRNCTGVSNGLILDNLERLLHSPLRERTIIRTPLIPGYTATEENVSAIARHITGLFPEVRYELLNYNPLAMSKYLLAGMAFCFAENPRRFDDAEMESFRAAARAAGVRQLVTE